MSENIKIVDVSTKYVASNIDDISND